MSAAPLLPLRRTLRSLALLAALLVPAAAGAAGPFDAELAARRAEVDRLAGRPEAIVPLLGVLDLWSDVDDRAAIAGLLDTASADRRQLPTVRARAGFLRSLLDERAGDFAAARKRRAALGLVSSWWVLGPFDDEGRAGDRAVLPPEQDLAGPLDRNKTYAGKDRQLRWRPFPEHLISQGIITLDAALRPDRHVLAYAVTFVRVDAPTWAAVRTGSTGAIKVWANGRLAIERDAYRPVRIDQDAGLVRLEKGWNRITVKVGTEEAGWAFFLRLTAPDGGPLPFEASIEPGGGAKGGRSASGAASWAKGGASARTGANTPPLADLAASLRAAADTGQAAAERAWGLYLHYVSPLDPAQGDAERMLRAAAEAEPSTRAWRLAALAATDGEKRRNFLEQAVALELLSKAPAIEKARALHELGDAYQRLHRERRAEELWHKALAAEPDFFPATLRLAELQSDRGLPARGEAMLQAVAKKHAALSIGRALAAMADRRGRRDDAERRWKALAEAARDDLVPLRELFGYAKDRGDVAAALSVLDRMAQARPDAGSLVADRADLLDGVGRSADAHRALSLALADCPDEPRLLERDGKVLHRLGRESEALAALDRALELRPQNPDLRAYAAAIREAITHRAPGAASGGDARGRSGDDLAREYARPVPELIAAARRAGSAAAGKGPARVLLDLSVTRVHANGLSESFDERVIEILDERGAREQRLTVVRYLPDTQSVEVKAARVYKKSGEVVEAPAQTEQDTSEPWYGLYYDTRAQVIEFPRLEPGDVVDFEYVQSDIANRNMFADYFGELHALQEELPRRVSEYVLITPKSRAFYFNQPKLPGVQVTQSEKGDERVYRVRAENVPKVDAEPGMPGFTSVAAYVHVSTYRTWEEVATWYQGLVRGQLDTDDAIKAAVKKAVAGIGDERQKIRAIYDLVVKQTRYVGLEFGIHGYKPYAVTQVFQRKFGDCKDKASLLVAMLREIGVEATLVLARTRRNGDVDPFPASLAPFDHAIAWVPKYDLFLDGTAEFSGSDELPAQDQDIPVLLVSDPRAGGQGHLARTPVLPAERNRVEREVKATIDAATGAAKVDLRMTVGGQSAQEWRSHYQNPGERRERFEKGENAAHPGTRVKSVDFTSVDDLEKPVEVRAQMEVPAWAQKEPGARGGAELSMPALGREGDLLRSYGRLSTRRHDLVLGFPWMQADRVRIPLPPGLAPRRLPQPRRVESPFGTFTLSVERHGDEVELSFELRVTRHRIGAAEYPAFRRFCLDVDAAMGQRLVLAHD